MNVSLENVPGLAAGDHGQTTMMYHLAHVDEEPRCVVCGKKIKYNDMAWFLTSQGVFNCMKDSCNRPGSEYSYAHVPLGTKEGRLNAGKYVYAQVVPFDT